MSTTSTTERATLPWAIRAGVDDDLPYLRDSWLRSWIDHGHGDPALRRVLWILGTEPRRRDDRAREWAGANAALRVHVTALLTSARVVVASPHGMPEEVIGWACGESPGVVHYAVVKRPYWRKGVVSSLLEALSRDVGVLGVWTHWTGYGASVAEALRLRYDPRPAWGPKQEPKHERKADGHQERDLQAGD